MNLNRFLTILSQSKLPRSGASVVFPTSYCEISVEMMQEQEYDRLSHMTGIRELQAEFVCGDICHGVSFRVKSEDGNFELTGF